MAAAPGLWQMTSYLMDSQDTAVSPENTLDCIVFEILAAFSHPASIQEKPNIASQTILQE